MNQSGSNPYANYGYSAPPQRQPQQQVPYYNTMQGAPQQPTMYPQQQAQQQAGQSTGYQGGPLAASGSLLVPTQNAPTTGVQVPGMLPIEQSYVENILRLNKGKLATVYMTFENNNEWNAKIFKGIIEAAGRDHIILSDPQTGIRYLLLMVYLDYITFDEEIEYDYPFNTAAPMSTYSPR
ncbi:spore coat protein GerQ [Bacillus testis]|uniref:spore coat protein GerQ n=1 Tax=Bacillus testis TaxID=1622072 RepID=UPI00067E75E7|nr:spore coat protein GerQ [Bacillus testis]